jgi:hypothetical protein
MSRLRRFTREEKSALERWSAACRMKDELGAGSLVRQPAPNPPDSSNLGEEPLDASNRSLVLPDPFEEVEGG